MYIYTYTLFLYICIHIYESDPYQRNECLFEIHIEGICVALKYSSKKYVFLRKHTQHVLQRNTHTHIHAHTLCNTYQRNMYFFDIYFIGICQKKNTYPKNK